MALGAVTMLVLAVMMMLSFSLANVVHEKIRLQSHTDAMAYSMATIEARAFNHIAYTNRGIAATLVAQMTLHAYMASASVTASMMDSGASNFQQIAMMEMMICMTCCWYPCFSMCEHCIHAGEAMKISGDYSDASDDYGDKVKDLEELFNICVQLLTLQADMIHWSQMSQVMYLSDQILLGRDLDELRKQNAPCSTELPGGVGLMNINELACALEGSHLDSMCWSRTRTQAESRSKVMGNAANAARAPYAKERGYFPMHLGPQFLMEFMTDLPTSDGFSVPISHEGTAKAMNSTDSSDCASSDQDVQASTICAVESGRSFSYFKHGVGTSSYSSEIYSDKNGGKHEPSNAHDPDHDKFKGAQREMDDANPDCLMEGNCFLSFDAEDDPDTDWGQPKVYAYHTQDLRIRDNANCSANRPWELGNQGQLTMGDGQRGDVTLTMFPRDTGRAVSKAMVYFHRFDKWQAPPNLFDPYWRAKLHPFKPMELGTVLGAASDTDGAGLANSITEGQL